MKSHEYHDGLGATDSAPQPGDFRLGSVEPRAAARAKLLPERELSPYDRDCLVIQSMVPLTYAYSPNSRDIHETDVGKRGWELAQTLDRIVRRHLDPFDQQQHRFQRCHKAYWHFHIIRRRLPVSGDVLQQQETENKWGVPVMAQWVGEFRAAWARRLPQLPCPVKFDQDLVWCRSAESKPGKEIWEQDYVPWTAPEIWPLIESEALGKESSPRKNRPTLSAIVFREDEDGNFYTQPFKVS